MSLCCSLTGEDVLEDLSLDDLAKSDKSQVFEPHNSTFIEEDCHLELKDIIPQDLSAIMGRNLLKCFCTNGKYTGMYGNLVV